MKARLLWPATFALHAVGTFIAWALADAPQGPDAAAKVSKVLMFPAFNVAGDIGNRWFWPVFCANSAIWATLLVALATRWPSSRNDDA